MKLQILPSLLAADFGRLSDELTNLGGKGKSRNEQQQKKAQDKKQSKRKFLNDYCKDLTAAAREGRLDRIIGREKELARMIQILMRRQKNNPCLIGEPGVGKTALADALALRIPPFAGVLRLSGTAVFARGVGLLVESGVSLLDALRVVAQLLGNRRLSRRVLDAAEAVTRVVPERSAVTKPSSTEATSGLLLAQVM